MTNSVPMFFIAAPQRTGKISLDNVAARRWGIIAEDSTLRYEDGVEGRFNNDSMSSSENMERFSSRAVRAGSKCGKIG